jgi:hypothetical protein
VLLALSVGFNAGLGVALLQQRSRLPEPVAGPRDSPAVAQNVAAENAGVTARPESVEDLDPPRQEEAGEDQPRVASASPVANATAARRPVTAPSTRPSSAGELGAAGEPPRPAPGPGRSGALRAAPAGPPQERLEEMALRLGVPEGDRAEFISLQRGFLGATRDTRMQLEGVRRQLKTELMAEQPDRGTVDELLARSTALQADLERALVDHVLAARELLDGEAERRYLHFLSRLHAGGGGPGTVRRPGPQGRQPGFGPGERPRRGWPPPHRRFPPRREPAPSPGP